MNGALIGSIIWTVWRCYIGHEVKASQQVPGILINIIEVLKCQQHSRVRNSANPFVED